MSQQEDDLRLFGELLEESKPLPTESAWQSLSEDRPARSPNLPKIPSFQLHSLLRRGGMGAVYKATQLGIDRLVALKIMKKELAQDSEFVRRFRIEARTAGMLHHENIVGAFEFMQVNDNYCLVMEYREPA
jgi:serine/threonine protein kinase